MDDPYGRTGDGPNSVSYHIVLSYRTIQDLLALSTIRQYKEFWNNISFFKSSFVKLCLVYENVVG